MPVIEPPSEFDEKDEPKVTAGIFDIGQKIGVNSEMRRELSAMTPFSVIAAFASIGYINVLKRRPIYTGMATKGLGFAVAAAFFVESLRTINYKRYTRRHKMVLAQRSMVKYLETGPVLECELMYYFIFFLNIHFAENSTS
uniref:Uncharacterized protein n=1 Tax=Magallana gigas TaxID=29159 RepID=A0A8W8L3F2_MAGGI